jgi:hypothetical protein
LISWYKFYDFVMRLWTEKSKHDRQDKNCIGESNN